MVSSAEYSATIFDEEVEIKVGSECKALHSYTVGQAGKISSSSYDGRSFYPPRNYSDGFHLDRTPTFPGCDRFAANPHLYSATV
ncbi:MAG TPA: hypothetical protein VF089_00330 [Candidatus Binatia bacterium]